MIRIGITLPPDEGQSAEQLLWSSGLVQNIVFLYDTLNMIEDVRAYVIGSADIAKKLGLRHTTAGPGYLNIIIELGSLLEKEQAERFRQYKGSKLIYHPVGNVMFLNMEAMTGFGQVHSVPENEYDAVWLLPQFWKTNAVASQLMHKCQVDCVPIVWDRRWVTKAYEPTSVKTVAIFEPSMSVVKTPIIPMLVAEQCNSTNPDLISKVKVFAAKQNKPTIDFVTKLSIAGKTELYQRVKSQDVLGGVSAVVSHTIENGFNYNWYELLSGGFPLIHNSELMPAGYRFPSFDIEYGAGILAKVLAEHDDPSIRKQYGETARPFLEKLLPRSAWPLYKELIQGVLG